MKCEFCKKRLEKREKKYGICEYCLYWKLYKPYKEEWKKLLKGLEEIKK